MIKRRLSPSDTKYQQAFGTVLQVAFDLPVSSPDWEAGLLAKLDEADSGNTNDSGKTAEGQG